MGQLEGKKIAILADNGFEQVELEKPKQALEQEGAITHVISPQKEEVKGWEMTDWGTSVKVDVNLSQAQATDYDALLLPGGVMNPDHLRTNKEAVNFVKEIMQAGKPMRLFVMVPGL